MQENIFSPENSYNSIINQIDDKEEENNTKLEDKINHLEDKILQCDQDLNNLKYLISKLILNLESKLNSMETSNVEHNEILVPLDAVSTLLKKDKDSLKKEVFLSTNGKYPTSYELYKNPIYKDPIKEQYQLSKDKIEKLVKTNNSKDKIEQSFKRISISREIFQFLLDEVSKPNNNSNQFINARLRIALILLTLFGFQLNELLVLKTNKILDLRNYTRYLTIEGKDISNCLFSDMQIILNYKTINSYLFTAQNAEKPLQREVMSRLLNQFFQKVMKQLDYQFQVRPQPIINIFSFKTGYINQLWLVDENHRQWIKEKLLND